MKLHKVFLWLPVILIVAGIFYSSAQPYQKQDIRPEISKYVDLEKVEEKWGHVKINYAGSEISIEKKGTANFIEFFIRKGSHFTVFFALGFFVCRAIRANSSTFRSALISFVLVAAYAAIDETHQNFTENRTPHVEDVMIDTAGGTTAILLASFLYRKRPIKKTSTRDA
jgi:VanZ family protein